MENTGDCHWQSLSPHQLTTIPSPGHTTWQGTRENVVQPWVSGRKSKWQAASSLCHNFHLRERDGVLAMTYTTLQTLPHAALCCHHPPPAHSARDTSSHCSPSAPAALLPRGPCLCKDPLPRCPHSSPIAPHSLCLNANCQRGLP